jgi:hypothetical protein
MTTKQNEFAAPLGSARAGHLEFARGASRISIHVDGQMVDLYRARFEGAVPMVFADNGRVTIEYPRLAAAEWLRLHRRAAEVKLNPTVPWDLVFGGGVSRVRADLRGLTLRSLEILGGASDVDVLLPEPHGMVSVRVAGGASNVAFHRPPGTAARVRVGGGVSKLTFDDQRLGAIGGETSLGSAGSERAPQRYELEIGGGASELTITEAPEVELSSPAPTHP